MPCCCPEIVNPPISTSEAFTVIVLPPDRTAVRAGSSPHNRRLLLRSTVSSHTLPAITMTVSPEEALLTAAAMEA